MTVAVSSSTTTDFRNLSDALMSAANQLSEQILGDGVDSGCRPAERCTGYSSTAQLQVFV